MAQQIMNAQNSIVLVPKVRSVTLGCRRLVAWGLELGLVTISAVVPWSAGQYVLMVGARTIPPPIEDIAGERPVPDSVDVGAGLVALNPMVQSAQNMWAWMAQIPPHQLHRNVPRLTNIFWSIALVAPAVVVVGQLIQVSYTGRTWPKQWLGIQVFSITGSYLSLHQVLVRELVRWGIPLLLVGGVTTALGVSFGLWTPLTIVFLAMVEGGMALVPGKRSWHDLIARTRVAMAAAKYLPISGESLLYSLPMSGHSTGHSTSHSPGHSTSLATDQSAPLNGQSLAMEGTLAPAEISGISGIRLYGEADDDEWWLTEADGNLTSLVLPPRPVPQRDGGRLILSPSTRPAGQVWWLVLSAMVLAWIVGFGIGRVYQSPATVPARDDAFLEMAQTLLAKTRAGEDSNAAILMLAQVDDPRTINYLSDLLSQSSQPETLATIQQALVSQGLDSLPSLLALSQVLETDLQQSLEAETRYVRLEQRHAVQSAIAKLLTVHSDKLAGIRLDRVNLGHYHDADRSFRLIQPGLSAAGTSWQGANLTQANLAGASFFDVGTDGRVDSYDDVISDLRGVTLVAARLEDANLQGAQLSAANLKRAELRNANLTYSNLERTQLTNASLMHVNATQGQWQGSNLVGADLTQAIFNGADLSQARLNRIEATHSSWTKAILPQSDWVEANLMGADFSQANLVGANFQGAQLDSIDFSRADLRQANLRNADLRQATLTGVNLMDADLAGAIFDDGTSVSGSFITPNAQLRTDNHLKGVNFSRVRNLDGRQLNYICAQGGVHPTCQQILDAK